jgi:hypothetical protein
MHSRKPSDSKHNKPSSLTALINEAKPLTAQQAVEDLHQIHFVGGEGAFKHRKISGGVTPESIKTPLVFHNPRGLQASGIQPD